MKTQLLLGLAAVTAIAAFGIANASVSTDQEDYAPGSVVTISGDNSNGAGYLPGEAVTVDVSGPNGYEASCEAIADEGGSWSCQVTLWDTDLAYGEYTYVATGQESGVSESGRFTDAVNLQSRESTCSTETNTFSTGATVCMRATGIGGPFPKSGEFKWWAPGLNPDSDVATRAQAFSTSDANETDSYAVGACGTWTVRIYQPASTQQAQDTFEVTGCTPANSAPVVTAAAAAFDEGTAKAYTASWTDADSGQTHTCTLDFGDSSGPVDGTVAPAQPSDAGTCSASHTYDDGPNSYTITVTVSDGTDTGSDTATATVNNVAPSGTFNTPPADVDEGSSFDLSISDVTDPSAADTAAGFEYKFDCGAGYGSYDTSSATSCSTAVDGPATLTVKGTVKDKDGGEREYTGAVDVLNVAPVITSFICPVDPVAVNTPVPLSGAFTDAGVNDTHTASIAWDDSSSSAGVVTEVGGSGTVSGTHAYTEAGIYTPQLTVTDNDADSDTKSCEYVVVYDPSAGFVTGGGWIMSPAGAYMLNDELTGKATFGFVSKYKKGANVPDGNTEFQFHAAGMNFKSTSYQWLVVSGSKATFKGWGTIDGAGNYGFLLSAIDGSPDKFRIKIWEVGGDVVYDNNLGGGDDADPATALGGGSIVIHTGGKK